MTTMISGKMYTKFVEAIKERIITARISVARSVNRELIGLYWDIGKMIVEKQHELGWGKAVVETLADDLQQEFPSVTGFSPRNLWDMKRLYEQYAQHEYLRQLVADIPWGHNLLIMSKVSDYDARAYYLENTKKWGWSRNVLLNQIKARAYERSLEEKIHNFEQVLPVHLAEQADEMLKSSYNLEFLGLGQAVLERELEQRLLTQLKEFMLELGYGFCFIANQYHITLGEKDYYIDLLFYHRFLKSLIAIELKTGEFKPEYAGKMDFYLNVLNEHEKAPEDHPAIGIILCAEKEQLIVEFSLKTKHNPIGVAEYHLYQELPKELQGKLPTARELTEGLRLKREKEEPKDIEEKNDSQWE